MRPAAVGYRTHNLVFGSTTPEPPEPPCPAVGGQTAVVCRSVGNYYIENASLVQFSGHAVGVYTVAHVYPYSVFDLQHAERCALEIETIAT